jgi:hypothetical protein
MNTQKLKNILNKTIILGLEYPITNIKLKIKKKIFRLKRDKASQKFKIKQSFNFSLSSFKEQNFINSILKSQEFINCLPQNHSDHKFIINAADNVCNNQFETFNKAINFPPNETNWQQDFKANLNPEINNIFYQDILIKSSKDSNFYNYSYDIKVPWELSRFQYLFFLGQTYETTNDEKYAKKLSVLVNDWIDNNPYLFGANWVGPMEVAIRSINWVYAFNFFKNSKSITTSFWQKFIYSLYQHAIYLEFNWEKHLPTNNHYLSDLIGYFYLCFFFSNSKHFKKRLRKIYKEILKEFFKQIQEDGSTYEGSTNYHKLTYEIFLHFYLLCKTNNLPLPHKFIIRFNKMLQFIKDCSDKNHNLVQIGDNDSGRILSGINTVNTTNSEKTLKHYPDFGLSIIKNKNWHITFRNPTFSPKQPSGHFHNDELSITLSFDGIPVLVDPGSYLYTANTKWRNFFRSAENHNTFYLSQNNESLENLDSTGLFELNKTTQIDTCEIECTNNNEQISITNYHKKHLKMGQTPYRNIHYTNDKFEINDWWNSKKINGPLECNWSLIFHPNIELDKKDRLTWNIKHKNKTLLKMQTTLKFTHIQGYYSPSYGSIQPCSKLVAQENIKESSLKQKITFKILKIQNHE